MNRYFAILGIALAVTIIFVIRAERGKEWVRYQKVFSQKQRCSAGASLKEAAAQQAEEPKGMKSNGLLSKVPEMKQIYINDLNLADRCLTCHLGVEEPSCKNEEKPFNAHPGSFLKDHPVEKFGCTTCHGGQGMATTVREAHGSREGSAQPMLAARYAYGYCGRCHKEPDFRAAPQLTEGRSLFREFGCPSCHEVKGYENFPRNGPPLSRIGAKVKKKWLLDYLLSPRDYWKNTPMPDYRFKEEQAKALAAFLVTLKGKGETSEKVEKAANYKPSLEKGRKLFEDAACLTCHDVKGLYYNGPIQVKKIGPELTRLSGKVNRDWLFSYLQDPRRYFPETRMPSFRFTAQEASDLGEYLLSFSPRLRRETASARPSNPSSALVEEGRKLVKDNNCAGCHEIEGIEAGKPGPELTDVGNKPSTRLDYGENPPGKERNLPNWLYAKVMTPHTFRPDTARMPYPNLNNPETDAVVTFLLTLSENQPPEKYIVREEGPPRRLYPLGGTIKALFDEFKCLSCHPLGTEGESVGPQLAFEGSRVNREWLEKYLETPTVIRPSLAAKMPAFKLTREEAKMLAEHSSHILLDDRIRDHGPVMSAALSGDYDEGKKLFGRKMACIACHAVEGKGGRVGPDLTRAGERLKPQWVYLWLKRPQSFLPDVRMPDFGLDDHDIASLTNYILARRPEAPEREEHKVLGTPEEPRKEDLLVSIEPLKLKFLPGEAVFMRYCSVCHGENGDGKGYNAEFLQQQPRNFTDAAYMNKKSDDDLFKVISEGGMSAGLSFLMPPWGRTLNEAQIRDVISYIRRFSTSPQENKLTKK